METSEKLKLLAKGSSNNKLLSKVYSKGSRKLVAAMLETLKRDVNEVFRMEPAALHPFAWTGLLSACRRLNVEVVDELLKRGANPNFTPNVGFSPLMAVAIASSEEKSSEGIACAELLIKAGVQIKNVASYRDCTLLTRALKNKAATFAQYLLEAGANPNQRDGAGEMPFSIAIKNVQLDMARFLLDCGANPYIDNLEGPSNLDLAKLNLSKDEKIYGLVSDWRLEFYEKHYKGKKDSFLRMLEQVNTKPIVKMEITKKVEDAPDTSDPERVPIPRKQILPKEPDESQHSDQVPPRNASPTKGMLQSNKENEEKLLDKPEPVEQPSSSALQCFLQGSENLRPLINPIIVPDDDLPMGLDSSDILSYIQEMDLSPSFSDISTGSSDSDFSFFTNVEDVHVPSEQEKQKGRKYLWFVLGSALISFSMLCYLRRLGHLRN